MPWFILIDNDSGYIYHDTAQIPDWEEYGDSEIDAARMGDESIGIYGREYALLDANPSDTSTGYDVYRADIDGGEAVTVIWDGQDQETIKDVIESCEYRGFVKVMVSES